MMKKFGLALMRLAQVKIVLGIVLLLTLWLTGNFASTSVILILGVGLIVASVFLFVIGLMSACVSEVFPEDMQVH